MLKNFRLHIEKDEQKQSKLEERLATQIITQHSNNINAFQRNIPSLLPIVKSPNLANYSLFMNKFGETNIVDYGLGRTLYGFHPEQEVKDQVARLKQHCAQVHLGHEVSAPVNTVDDLESVQSIQELSDYKIQQQQGVLPPKVECLLIMGCGLGLHLKMLLEQHEIKNLIIYEPELQYFQCSVMAAPWHEILELAKTHGTALFLQLEKDGRDLVVDINELKEHVGISSFYVFKHYNHPVFDTLYSNLCKRTWRDIENSGLSIEQKENFLDYLPQWTPTPDLGTYKTFTKENERYINNLKAFKQYFPDIYEKYKDYKPRRWLPITNQTNEVNMLKTQGLCTWYGHSPKNDCILNFENFNEQPNKDGLVLGYSGTKLAHYIHYQFVKETEELLKQAEEEVGALPDNVPSIIMFGLGVGYQLEKLLKDHTVEKLFLCEPNPDFFYASLFAIDWQNIFETVEQSDTRIYLNIGDDGTNLFRDLLHQFYAVGPYILNSTYFYQSYYNSSLNSAISQLREQLQVVISMGEYFDHAYYGIAHTKEGMRRKIPVLAANPVSKLSYDDKEVPIFIVGNGPSLDSSIEAIKEWQGQAIIVSCGTTLQALHRHGITPDFHAEIEQNRSTYDWAVLIGDLDYLKKITLLSCNGIHPDTCDLYKDVMVAFKEGESSTVSALNVLGRENFTALLNAFPTVSNFAIDLFSTIGFTNIYLIGVDLGFVDVKHHHSKSSGYYLDDGSESHDYSKSANTSLVVAGNFRPKVSTKHEFKVSKQIIEQVTHNNSRDQTFYNCSDGAQILGALPIRPDDLLIVATEAQKLAAVRKLKTIVFSDANIGDFIQRFEQMFSSEELAEELKTFEALLRKKINSPEDINQLINKQKEMLFSSYQQGHSLLFYYLYGTINYVNAMLTKLNNSLQFNGTNQVLLQQALDCWLSKFNAITKLVSFKLDSFDTSAFKLHEREKKQLARYVKSKSILIITDSGRFADSVIWLLKNYFLWNVNLCIRNTQELANKKEKFDFVIYNLHKLNTDLKIEIMGTENTIFSLYSHNFHRLSELSSKHKEVTFTPIIKDEEESEHIRWMSDSLSIAAMLVHYCALGQKCHLLLPKYTVCNKNASTQFNEHIFKLDRHAIIFDYTLYMAVYSKNELTQLSIPNDGTRGTMLVENISYKNHVYMALDEEPFVKKSNKFRNLVPITPDDRFLRKVNETYTFP